MSQKPSGRASSSASVSRGFDAELAELETLSEVLKGGAVLTAQQVEYLRRMLGHRNNFLVSKAATLATHAELETLLPDVLTAYGRFFIDAAKSDPKCWAKEALAKALVKLGHRTKDAYLRGMRHHQMEPSFGPPVDTAGALRGTCAQALVDCPGISDADLLMALMEPLTDKDKSVRMEAALAMAAVGGVSAALLMRLRIMIELELKAGEEPEVMGAMFSALLSLEGATAIPLVAKAMEGESDLAGEAAFALAELRTEEALAALIARQRAGADAWFHSALLSAIALTRMPPAWEYLIAMIAEDGRDAPDAIEALARIAPSAELRARMEQAVEQADSLRLKQALRKHLPAQ